VNDLNDLNPGFEVNRLAIGEDRAWRWADRLFR